MFVNCHTMNSVLTRDEYSFSVPVEDLLMISEKLREAQENFKSYSITTDATNKILETIDSALMQLLEIYQAHGSIAFFTKGRYNVSLPVSLIDKLTSIVGWL